MHLEHDLKILRHSAAHLLAHAVTELFPETLLTIGPATEEGFFYDFLPTTNFKEEDLARIDKRMQELAAKNLPLTHQEISKEEARLLYHNNPFKLELIDGIPGDTVGLSVQGDFKDLCRGGHVASTGELKHVKLLSLAGSYWRANKDGQVLQRIYGTAFFTADGLKAYEQYKQDILEFDHRRLGKAMDLFSFHEEGVGFPFFHPKGQRVINALTKYMRDLHREFDYEEIATPTLLSDELWRQSGHYAHYKDKMYFCAIDEKNYAVKPMNCPGSILIYKTRPRSYRELPLKLAEFGHVHRHELSGVLHGLLRVRAFTQDDAHIYCMPSQLKSELTKLIHIVYTMLAKCGFSEVLVAVSTKPLTDAFSNDALWDQATNALIDALKENNKEFSIKEGEGAFYGPKIEIVIKDSMGRSWQCGTIQVDFFQSENFDLSYIASSGAKERPVIIHQAIFGSLERFFAILLEHYKGNLPFWLAPTQVRILTITDAQREYAYGLYQTIKSFGIRVEFDETSDPLSGKIKSAQQDKIPWMLVIGQKEVDNKTITLRYNTGKQEFGLSLEVLLEKIKLLA